MKIHINEVPELKELEITISCNRIGPEVERLLSRLRVLDSEGVHW